MPKSVKTVLTRAAAVFAAVLIAVFMAGCFGGNAEHGGVWGGIRRLIGANSATATFCGTFSPDYDIDFVTADDMDAVKRIIEARLANDEIKGYKVTCNYETHEITVTYPVYGDVSEFNPQQAAMAIAARGHLTFCRNDDKEDVILSGRFDVEDAAAQYTETGEYGVYINLTQSGAEKFAEATAQLVGQNISIWLDDSLLCNPTVNMAITNGKAVITGLASVKEADSLAGIINNGELPFSLKCDSIRVDK